jgi:regulator of replication initiation timing
MNKDEELEHLRQENQALHIANQTLREGLREAIHATHGMRNELSSSKEGRKSLSSRD